jgi:hypothetical protein
MARGFLADFESPEWKLSQRAVELDEPMILEEAISMTEADNLDSFYRQAIRSSIRHNAITVLKQLINRGVSVQDLIGSDVAGTCKTKTATVELLLENGWDINARGKVGSSAKPFMWHFVDNDDMIKWCLDHGASVHPRNQEPLNANFTTLSQRSCEQILELVAAWGSISTFELLRSKGAPLGWRPLHRAVETATYLPPTDKRPSEYQDRMDMVRYLIEVVKIDVNAPDWPAGAPGSLGPPICYIPASAMQETDKRELTWLLLDHGADPKPALDFVGYSDCRQFVEDVEAWRAQKSGGSKCCVQ